MPACGCHTERVVSETRLQDREESRVVEYTKTEKEDWAREIRELEERWEREREELKSELKRERQERERREKEKPKLQRTKNGKVID